MGRGVSSVVASSRRPRTLRPGSSSGDREPDCVRRLQRQTPQGLGRQAIADGRVPGDDGQPRRVRSAWVVAGAAGSCCNAPPGIISGCATAAVGVPGIGPAPGGGHWSGCWIPRFGWPARGTARYGRAFTGPSSDKGGREFGAGTPASGGLGLGGGLIGMAGGAVQSAIGAAGLKLRMPPAVVVVVLLVPPCCQPQRRSASKRVCGPSHMQASWRASAFWVDGNFQPQRFRPRRPGKSWLGRVAMVLLGRGQHCRTRLAVRVASRTTRWLNR